MFFEQRADRKRLGAFLVLLERRHVRRRSGRRSPQNVFENPLAAQYRRSAVRLRRHREQLPGRASPRRFSSVAGYPPELRTPVNIRNPVVFSQPLHWLESYVVCIRESRSRTPLMCPSWMMLAKNSSVSFLKLCRKVSSKFGKSSSFGATLCRLRRKSHWPAKLFTKASAFGSASMRRTCFSSAAGSLNFPCAAALIRSSSGRLLHRKNESREASSRSLTR